MRALSAEPPKIITPRGGRAYAMPVRLRAEMAVRYAAAVEDLQRLVSEGALFCWISSHASCSPRCADFQGKLYSLFQGKVTLDGKEYGESGTIDGIPYRPINEALAGKNGDGNGCISGYNCRHRAVEYKRGSRPPQDFTEATMRREYAVDKQQRSYENRIRQMKTEEKLLRSIGMTEEASALRKKWRLLTLEYQEYSISHDRAYYPYRCTIDKDEISDYEERASVTRENLGGQEPPPPYREDIIGADDYIQKFVGLGNKLVVRSAMRESRRCIRKNDGTTDERGVFIDVRGDSVFTFSGQNFSATYARMNFEKYPQSSLVLVHNHPYSSSFSFNDILTISDHPQIKTIVASGHDGSVYTLSIGDGKRVDKSAYGVYNRKVSEMNGDIHLAMIELAIEYGWRYQKI